MIFFLLSWSTSRPVTGCNSTKRISQTLPKGIPVFPKNFPKISGPKAPFQDMFETCLRNLLVLVVDTADEIETVANGRYEVEGVRETGWGGVRTEGSGASTEVAEAQVDGRACRP
jgi:hypothetical protein